MLVDSHCHLNYPEYQSNLKLYLDRAKANGVQFFLAICTELDKFPEILNIAKNFDNIFCSVGTHPHESKLATAANAQAIVDFTTDDKVVGIGECGLDYYYNHSDHAEQVTVFQHHLEASHQSGLPVIIHTRDAEQQTIKMLEETQAKKPVAGVLHCFTGSSELAKKALDLGLYISISGIVTFKNAYHLREIVAWLPEDRLLIETDAPFLAPVPHRGQPNEPAFLKHTAQFIAGIRGITLEKLAQLTTTNFFTLFKKAKKNIL